MKVLGAYALLLPGLELATAAWLVSRVAWKRYPMLILYLVTEAIAQTATVLAWRWWVAVWVVGQPVRMIIRLLVVFELFRLACVPMDRAQRLGAAAWVTGIAAACAGSLTAVLPQLSPLGAGVLFRQYFHVLLAACLVGLTLYIRKAPIAENRDHRVYRTVMTLIMLVLAVCSAFVPHGFGYLVFPYTKQTWQIVDVVSWAGMAVLIVALGWGMTSSISCLRFDVAFRNRDVAAMFAQREREAKFHQGL